MRGTRSYGRLGPYKIWASHGRLGIFEHRPAIESDCSSHLLSVYSPSGTVAEMRGSALRSAALACEVQCVMQNTVSRFVRLCQTLSRLPQPLPRVPHRVPETTFSVQKSIFRRLKNRLVFGLFFIEFSSQNGAPNSSEID